jgi:uncharacterized protein YodC (DUF2158 family)
MTTDRWSSGLLVKLRSSGRQMTVVGVDRVGSVICEWPAGDHHLRGYFNPMTLIIAENTENV